MARHGKLVLWKIKSGRDPIMRQPRVTGFSAALHAVESCQLLRLQIADLSVSGSWESRLFAPTCWYGSSGKERRLRFLERDPECRAYRPTKRARDGANADDDG